MKFTIQPPTLIQPRYTFAVSDNIGVPIGKQGIVLLSSQKSQTNLNQNQEQISIHPTTVLTSSLWIMCKLHISYSSTTTPSILTKKTSIDRESRCTLLLCSSKSLLNLAPVDNIPDGIHIVGTDIPVVHIIGMLPNINSKKRHKTSSCVERILVSTGCWFDASYEMKQLLV